VTRPLARLLSTGDTLELSEAEDAYGSSGQDVLVPATQSTVPSSTGARRVSDRISLF